MRPDREIEGLKLECLRLACSVSNGSTRIVEAAEKMHAWLTGSPASLDSGAIRAKITNLETEIKERGETKPSSDWAI